MWVPTEGAAERAMPAAAVRDRTINAFLERIALQHRAIHVADAVSTEAVHMAVLIGNQKSPQTLYRQHHQRRNPNDDADNVSHVFSEQAMGVRKWRKKLIDAIRNGRDPFSGADYEQHRAFLPKDLKHLMDNTTVLVNGDLGAHLRWKTCFPALPSRLSGGGSIKSWIMNKALAVPTEPTAKVVALYFAGSSGNSLKKYLNMQSVTLLWSNMQTTGIALRMALPQCCLKQHDDVNEFPLSAEYTLTLPLPLDHDDVSEADRLRKMFRDAMNAADLGRGNADGAPDDLLRTMTELIHQTNNRNRPRRRLQDL